MCHTAPAFFVVRKSATLPAARVIEAKPRARQALRHWRP
ncbi:hypothetical protein BVI434_60013 [Burkholderia vietnamiensis]|nr:hypothetical protein BVI434_60013 [Burkholderia vietnamiensis]